MANSWNESGTTWSTGRWGTTDAITSGWGADAWNTGGSWGKATDEIVFPTGLSATFSLGELISGSNNCSEPDCIWHAKIAWKNFAFININSVLFAMLTIQN